MAAHAFQSCARGEVPEENGTLIVCGGERLAVGTAFDGGDVARMSCEHAYRIATGDIPHTYVLVSGCKDVCAVRVESTAIYVGVVRDEHSKWSDVFCIP